jgi:hypothetical protein
LEWHLRAPEATVAPRDDVRDVEVIFADLDSHVRVRRQSGNLLQQLVAHHRERSFPDGGAVS